MAEPRYSVTVQFDPDTYRRLNALMAANDMNRSQVVKTLIQRATAGLPAAPAGPDERTK